MKISRLLIVVTVGLIAIAIDVNGVSTYIHYLLPDYSNSQLDQIAPKLAYVFFGISMAA